MTMTDWLIQDSKTLPVSFMEESSESHCREPAATEMPTQPVGERPQVFFLAFDFPLKAYVWLGE